MKIYAFAAALGAGRVPALTLMGLALFSICYFELLGRFRSPRRLRWGVAFLFGLLHGFGFASVLTDAHWRPTGWFRRCSASMPASRSVNS
jgi:hypothetical protein